MPTMLIITQCGAWSRQSARTVLKVLKREGISAEDHATMPEFMGAGAKTP